MKPHIRSYICAGQEAADNSLFKVLSAEDLTKDQIIIALESVHV